MTLILAMTFIIFIVCNTILFGKWLGRRILFRSWLHEIAEQNARCEMIQIFSVSKLTRLNCYLLFIKSRHNVVIYWRNFMWGLRDLPRAFSSAIFSWKLPSATLGRSLEIELGKAYIILYDWINFDVIQDGSPYTSMQRVQIWRETMT